MLRKDYYLILGIPREESAAGIHAAYRDLAKRHHPDVAGAAGAGPFREITEAYEVLSDPFRRDQYNHYLAQSEASPGPGVLRRAAEPVVPPPPSLFDRPDSIRPSFEELFDRYRRNSTGVDVPKAEVEEGLNIEVLLSPEEALLGGVLPVTLPVFTRCPVCQGTGFEWLFACLHCHAEGLIERHETVRVRIPPGIRSSTVIEFPLRGLGVHNFYLRVHIFVGGH